MRTRDLLPIAALILLTCAMAGHAHACACCASTGQRHVATGPISEYEAGELRRIGFANAELFTGEGEAGDVRGLAATASSYELELTRSGATWTFTFKDKGTIAGTLSFQPDKLAKFEVDTRAEPASETGTVTLYKEWKQTAPLTATGMFKLQKGSLLSLILQGRGNGCTSADDFTHFALVAQSDGISFHFFGDLAKPR